MKIQDISIKVNGVRVYHINMESKFIEIGITTKEKFLMVQNLEMEHIVLVKGMFIMAHFITIKVMGLGKCYIIMVINMKDSGNWANFKVKGFLNGKMVRNMKAII